MTVENIPFTLEGYKELQSELEDLKKVQRPKVIEAIAEARAHGDLKENAEYHAAREKQAFIEGRISLLEDQLSRGEVVKNEDLNAQTIRFGAWVTLQDEETGESKKYRIVGDLEADINKNRISLSSPIAKAIIGKKVDDEVEIRVPKGIKDYVIIKVEYS